MDNFVVTIARQYGSGGRTVGEMLAKKLGIGYYDRILSAWHLRTAEFMKLFLEE